MKLKIISTEKIIHKSHNYKYDRPSCLGVISSYYRCQNCGDEQPSSDYYLQPDKCITYKHTYLYPPTFIWESRSICSMEQRERAISETANIMLKYIKKNQHLGIPSHYIYGTTSITSQAYEKLMNNNQIKIENGNVILNKN